MLKETVELCYTKEDKRREDQCVKEKKKLASQPQKKPPTKYEIPLEAVTLAFKQELFETCYKRITKRIAAAKKKAKANKDLKSVSKGSTMNASIAAKELGKTAQSKLNAAASPGRKTGENATPDKSGANAQ